MKNESDYYKLLGVEVCDSLETIKTAYRRLAPDLHPDQNPNNPQAEEKFKALCEAYRVLSDPELRARYDKNRKVRFSKPQIKSRLSHKSTLRKFFENLRKQAGPRPKRGEDLQYALELGPGELAQGGIYQITLPCLKECPRCEGAWRYTDCGNCAGTGRISGKKAVRIQIPRGVTTGSQFRMMGEGNAGVMGKPSGDLWVVVRERKSIIQNK